MGFHYLAVMFVVISLKIRLCNGPKIHSGAQRHFIGVSEQLKLRYQETYAIHVDRVGEKCVVSNISTKLQAPKELHTPRCDRAAFYISRSRYLCSRFGAKRTVY